MMLKPLGNRVIIKKLEAEEKTASGIVLPTQAKEKPQLAEIVAIGKDVEDVKIGDKVVFKKYVGTEIKVDNEEVTICEMEDILAILE
ncbi:co-chaperone GroES [Fusibacter ferrireducens]|uniref:Co-chaperonin GroES n=1 Tax=Fusibacter ferrireducens TaxID=2785058 RepID=A0ABR9ZYP6_9FIRM|nr:co-chaperone GroES [Fusibacter ferrireducens]MBF4695010.1 co-chaperone GroES [Fusibacter ferrireducens]